MSMPNDVLRHQLVDDNLKALWTRCEKKRRREKSELVWWEKGLWFLSDPLRSAYFLASDLPPSHQRTCSVCFVCFCIVCCYISVRIVCNLVSCSYTGLLGCTCDEQMFVRIKAHLVCFITMHALLGFTRVRSNARSMYLFSFCLKKKKLARYFISFG